MGRDDRYSPNHPQHRELMLPCCSLVRKAITCAALGDMVDPSSLPESLRIDGGGWVGGKYVCSGAHRDRTFGFKVLEVK